MPFAAAGGRVALNGTPVDDKPCIAMTFTLRPGKHPVQVLLASAAVRNPPPPGLIMIVTLRGSAPDQVRVISVLESHAALANALARAPVSALKKLGEVVIPGADIWIGPVGCIPHSVVPRPAVVRALVDGADSITVPPRRADGDAPHLADVVFGHDSRPQLEALFAKRYYCKRRVNWYATEPFSTVTSSVVHAFEVEPVRFEMAPGATAALDAAAPPPPRHQGDRGYGARQYTYQHRPHDPPVERPAPSTSAAELQGAGSVLRLRSEEEGLRAAAAVLRNQQAFVDLGWRAHGSHRPATIAATPPSASVSPPSPFAVDIDGHPDGPRRAAPQMLREVPRSNQLLGLNGATAASHPASVTAASASKKPQPQCAKVLCAGQKQLQCYVDQRLVLAPEPGDIVVIGPPPSPGPSTGDDGEACSSAPPTVGASDADADSGPLGATFLGRVVGVSRWSRGKAGAGQRYHAALRRACVLDVTDADITACAETPAIGKLRAQLPCGALGGLYRTKLHANDPSVLTLAEVSPDAGAECPSGESLRAAVAAATGAPRRHVFRIVPVAAQQA